MRKHIDTITTSRRANDYFKFWFNGGDACSFSARVGRKRNQKSAVQEERWKNLSSWKSPHRSVAINLSKNIVFGLTKNKILLLFIFRAYGERDP